MSRAYSEKQITDALAALDANGGNLLRTSRDLGIPRKTLADWASGTVKKLSSSDVAADVAETRQKSRSDLAARLREILWDISDQFTTERLKASPINHLSTLFGTLFDKLRLLEGKATAINETRLERHKWAETKLAEIMREYQLTRAEALEFAEIHAPTIKELVSGQPQAEPAAGQNSEAIS